MCIVFLIIDSYFTFLIIVSSYAILVDVSVTIKPILVTDVVTEVDSVAIITNVSKDFFIVDSLFYFNCFFFKKNK